MNKPSSAPDVEADEHSNMDVAYSAHPPQPSLACWVLVRPRESKQITVGKSI